MKQENINGPSLPEDIQNFNETFISRLTAELDNDESNDFDF